MVLRHSLAFLYLWCKSHIDLLNNLLGAIICEMGIDIQGDLCTFMPSKVLDGFDIYAPEQQVCDVCVAKDMRGHLRLLPVVFILMEVNIRFYSIVFVFCKQAEAFQKDE